MWKKLKMPQTPDTAPPKVCVCMCVVWCGGGVGGGGQSRGVSERWENLSELGHLSQMYPCTFTDPPQGNDSGSRWGLVNSMWGTVGYCLSAKGVCICVSWFCLFPFISWSTSHLSGGQSARKPQPGAPTVTQRAIWDLDTMMLYS